jgi:putative PIN family toxin of toxin-antitoxin system
MALKVIYDTNVIVSAIWKPGSIPASLVALAMEKQVRLFFSPAIFEEYQEVLKRPKFGFNPQLVEAFLRDLTDAGEMVRPTQMVNKSPDKADNRFLECSQAAQADYLVTGNRRHFPFLTFEGTKIVTPSTFARTVAELLYIQGPGKTIKKPKGKL